MKHGIDKNTRPVGYHHLFEQAPQNHLHPLHQIGSAQAMRLIKLPRQLPIAPDRPLDDLRKKGNEQRKPAKMTVRFYLAAVDIHHIADRLQRVIRNAQRHNQLQVRHQGAIGKQAEDRVDRFSKEIKIFKKQQQPEIKEHRKEYNQLFLLAVFCRSAFFSSFGTVFLAKLNCVLIRPSAKPDRYTETVVASRLNTSSLLDQKNRKR